VCQLKARERELSQKVQEAMAQVKVLRGLMPICANCQLYPEYAKATGSTGT
jgi:hypothetical protein